MEQYIERLEDRIKKLEEENKNLQTSYVPQDVAAECLEMLKPLEVAGEPNTLWALIRKAMVKINDIERAKYIEEDWNKKLELARPGVPYCWLTWAMRENGIVELRAVSLTPYHAEYSRKSLKDEEEFGIYQSNPLVRVWSEKRWSEHIYGLSGASGPSDEVIQEIGKEESPQFKEFLATQYSKARARVLAAEDKVKELEEELKKYKEK